MNLRCRLVFVVLCAARLADGSEERTAIESERKALADKMTRLRASGVAADTFADADVFLKGVTWALRYDVNLNASDVALVKKSILRGQQRIDALIAKQTPWNTKKGAVLRGFISAVDGSTQPYGVIVPRGYDSTKPMRLDVVLHGSTKPVGMSELRFCARFDDGDSGGKPAPDTEFIELHPLGRVENCYRCAGETDVFEAIEAACRNYNIDRDRIVLRGMSMGASGTWHLGLKHPDRFVALGPYCGYVDTHRFSVTPGMSFVPVGQLPPHQESALHMLDSVDYAANATMVPAIAAIGGKDGFFDAHVIMGDAMAREGVQMINLVSPHTKHVIDPITHAAQMKLIGLYAEKGLEHSPRKLRFVTWTLKYSRCHWLELLGLKQHYERAEFIASFSRDGTLEIEELKNITAFAIHLPCSKVRIAGKDIAIPNVKNAELVFSFRNGAWSCRGDRELSLSGKRPGLQGPIDDVFATPFLCVRGTGKAWNPQIAAWADASLRRFEYEWARYMRGDLPVKNDIEVTDEDVRTKHLILFGDPGSNAWIAKALAKLPLAWNAEQFTLAGEQYSSKDHAPVLICASPLAPDRYIVLNSGHTFHEKEFAAFNYLLFPRLGDWATMRTLPGADTWKTGDATFPEEVVRAGFFDEQWAAPILSGK
ncbi:MAG TPA: hypothetical protein VEK08_24585 [Planctomycetota bacterium]|nr:hypothetical protein [Planctomycetota bacterium]